jgi:O-methyltransferase involved in polyketide biosynthesis
MTLRSLMQSNYWRVQMAWPDSNPRYFGKFNSRTEAEKWIAEHQWLTKHVWAEDCNARRSFDSSVMDDAAQFFVGQPGG